MDARIFSTVFMTIFIAELGDKTQLATLLYAAERNSPKMTVFLAAASALIATTAVGVVAGATIAEFLNPKMVRWVAGLGFISVGVWMLLAPE